MRAIIPLILLIAGFLQLSGKPNILLIMADDMGYSDLGCFGGEIRTPSLDSLAENGIRFTNFYSENMCWVSRASMMTGIYHRVSPKSSVLHPRCLTLPEALKDNGYRTGMMGKWHLAGDYTKNNGQDAIYPDQRGFDHFYGILGGASSFYAPFGLKRNRDSIDHEFMNDENYYFTNAIGNEAISFLEQTPDQKPFFLYLPFTAAHWPLHAPAKDIEKYKGVFSEGWDQLRTKRLERMKKLGVIDKSVKLSPRHPKVPSWKDEKHQDWQERRMEVYAAQVTIMDRVIGNVIQHLEKIGRLNDTLIFFTIDNGGCQVEYSPQRKGGFLPEKTRKGEPMKPGNLPHIMPGPEITYQSYGHGWANLSNTPYRQFKQYDHEGGIHTPMIVHWPNKMNKKGSISHTLSHLVDLMPTILEASNITPTSTIRGQERFPWDGRSILPSIEGKKQKDPSLLFFSYARGKAIRVGNWKLVFNKDNKKEAKWELYDMKKDPNELNDLAKSYPNKVEQLAKLWQQEETEHLRKSKL